MQGNKVKAKNFSLGSRSSIPKRTVKYFKDYSFEVFNSLDVAVGRKKEYGKKEEDDWEHMRTGRRGKHG